MSKFVSLFVYFIILVVYNVSVFLLVDDFNNVFWVSYVFMMGMYLLHVGTAQVAALSKDKDKKFLGFPASIVTGAIVVVEFLVSTVFYLLKDDIGVVPVIIVEVIIISVMFIVMLLSSATKEVLTKSQETVKVNTLFIKGIVTDMEYYVKNCEEPETKKMLKKLSETAEYSDPMSNEVVAFEEDMITQGMARLRDAFVSGDMTEVRSVCAKLEDLFETRNKKLIATKK